MRGELGVGLDTVLPFQRADVRVDRVDILAMESSLLDVSPIPTAAETETLPRTNHGNQPAAPMASPNPSNPFDSLISHSSPSLPVINQFPKKSIKTPTQPDIVVTARTPRHREHIRRHSRESPKARENLSQCPQAPISLPKVPGPYPWAYIPSTQPHSLIPSHQRGCVTI
mgnify:CR=1 FL=1